MRARIVSVDHQRGILWAVFDDPTLTLIHGRSVCIRGETLTNKALGDVVQGDIVTIGRIILPAHGLEALDVTWVSVDPNQFNGTVIGILPEFVVVRPDTLGQEYLLCYRPSFRNPTSFDTLKAGTRVRGILFISPTGRRGYNVRTIKMKKRAVRRGVN